MQKIAIIALVKKEDAILLVKHFKRGWDIPGGYVFDEEDILSAVKREVYEETGLDVSCLKLSAIYSNLQYEELKGEKATKLILGFTCEHKRGEIRPSLETPEIKFVKLYEIEQYVKDELQVDRITHLLGDELKYYAYIKNPYSILVEKSI